MSTCTASAAVVQIQLRTTPHNPQHTALPHSCLVLLVATGPVYDTSMRAAKFDGPAHRFISWNVAGMRALMKKDAEALRRLVDAEQLDAVCLQVCVCTTIWSTGVCEHTPSF